MDLRCLRQLDLVAALPRCASVVNVSRAGGETPDRPRHPIERRLPAPGRGEGRLAVGLGKERETGENR